MNTEKNYEPILLTDETTTSVIAHEVVKTDYYTVCYRGQTFKERKADLYQMQYHYPRSVFPSLDAATKRAAYLNKKFKTIDFVVYQLTRADDPA